MSTATASDQLLEALGLPLETDVIEWHHYGSETTPDTTWRHLQVPTSDTADRSAVDLDDSTWALSDGPWGDQAGPYTAGPWPAPAVAWPISNRLWLRRHIAGTGQQLRLRINHDAVVTVYWNGVQVASSTQPLNAVTVVTIPATDVLADNVLTVLATDPGSPCYVQVALWATDPGHYSTTALATSPAAAWMFDETAGTTAADSSGNSRPLTVSGATLGQVGLAEGKAVTLNGTSNYLQAASAGWVNTPALTIEAWIRPNVGGVGAGDTYRAIVSADGTARRFTVYLHNGRVEVWGNGMKATSNATIQEVRVYHIVVTVTGSAAALYINGALDKTFTWADLGGASATTLTVGAWNASGTRFYYFAGKVDGITIHAAALTASEVAGRYAAANGGANPTGGGTTAPAWLVDPDRTAALSEYTTVHGRPTPLENTSPLQAKVRLARILQGDQVPTVGERFRLTLNADVATALGVSEDERPRFTGTITDVDIVPDRHDPEGVRTVLEVTGVGRSARLGSTPIKKLNRPGELDGSRVRRILYAAAITLPIDIGTIDAGVRQLLPLAALNQSAKSLVDDVIADTLGQLVEHRSGRLDWHDAEHRRDTASLVSLAGDQHLIQPFKWSQAIGTVVNTAQVSYGDPRAVETVRDPASVDELGPYGVQLDTDLAEATDAASLAGTIVGRYSRPAWMIPALTVDVVRTAGPAAGAVLALSHGDKITAAGLPPDGAFEAGDLFVEGTTETFTRTAWRVSLAVADPAIAGVGLRWIDIPATETWSSLAPLTWLQLATAAPEDL